MAELQQLLFDHLSGKENKKISNQEFLDAELSMGISANNPLFVALCNATANELVMYSDIKSVLDYGAGTGVYANALHNKGFDVKVFELFDTHQAYIKEKYPHLQIIDKPVTTDCLFWIEVSEHMTDKEIDDLFNSIDPKYIYHSSTSKTTENDIMWGHINIKTQDQWIELFRFKGYELIKQPFIPTLWTKIYKKI
jgi:2-polyprenyl-3-methyl-5-hydroxy-6-metoxy-1,4-benzoquinol methylase